MHEIKFRAWTDNLKDGGEMYYQYPSPTLSPLFSPAGYGLLNPSLTFMQFTGLLDKNGKEVYEGDIVKNGKDIAVVTFEAPEFIALFGESDENCCNLLFGNFFEIIGNIYENPELLIKQENV